MRTGPATEEIARAITRQKLEMLISRFNQVRALQCEKRDIVHEGPYPEFRNIVENLKALRTRGWLNGETVERLQDELLHEIIWEPGFVPAMWLKALPGPFKDFALDDLICGLTNALKKLPDGKPRYRLSSDFLTEQDIHPLAPKHEPGNHKRGLTKLSQKTDHIWGAKLVQDRYEEISKKPEEVSNIDALLEFWRAKDLLGAMKAGGEITVEEWRSTLVSTVNSVDPGNVSTGEWKFREAKWGTPQSPRQTAVSKGLKVGRAKSSSKK